jgi:RNA polymerase sigma factor (sigma-70 family)
MYCRRELKRKHEIMIPNPSSMTEEEKIDLRDAVDNLPEKVRLVVLGRFFENKSVAEMAKEMGYTRQYIKQLLDKGIAELHLVYE